MFYYFTLFFTALCEFVDELTGIRDIYDSDSEP